MAKKKEWPVSGLAVYYGGRSLKQIALGNAQNAEHLAQVAAHHALGSLEQRRSTGFVVGGARRRAWYLPYAVHTPGACQCLLGIA